MLLNITWHYRLLLQPKNRILSNQKHTQHKAAYRITFCFDSNYWILNTHGRGTIKHPSIAGGRGGGQFFFTTNWRKECHNNLICQRQMLYSITFGTGWMWFVSSTPKRSDCERLLRGYIVRRDDSYHTGSYSLSEVNTLHCHRQKIDFWLVSSYFKQTIHAPTKPYVYKLVVQYHIA